MPAGHPVEGSGTFVNSTGEPTYNPSSFVNSANEVNQTSEPQDSADHSRQREEELVDDELPAEIGGAPEEHHQEEVQVVNETEEQHDEEGHVDADAA